MIIDTFLKSIKYKPYLEYYTNIIANYL